MTFAPLLFHYIAYSRFLCHDRISSTVNLNYVASTGVFFFSLHPPVNLLSYDTDRDSTPELEIELEGLCCVAKLALCIRLLRLISCVVHSIAFDKLSLFRVVALRGDAGCDHGHPFNLPFISISIWL